MKIGILTYFWAENPGTFLQAYSMQQAFRRRFPNSKVELINYRHRWVYFKPNRSRISFNQWVKDFKRYTTYRKMQSKYLLTSQDRLVSRNSQQAWEFIEKQHYDLIVVGSDTILELQQRHRKHGGVPVYWLPPRISCKKVMCAASSRALSYEELSDSQRKAFRESVNSFDLIGVRDDLTFALIKALGLKDESKLQMIPDPTFTFKIDYSHVERLVQQRNMNFSKPTVALNLPRTFKPATELASYYKAKGFQVLSLVPAKYGDICLTDISPFEWAGIYADLHLVITDRFHGTVFSLKNLTPVVSLVCDRRLITNGGLSKYYSLLKLFGLHNTNCINTVGMNNIDRVIQITDNAMHNFDKRFVQEKLKHLTDQFNRFVDKIADLLTKTL